MMSMPPGYEKKFADFIKLCSEAKTNGTEQVVIGYPWALGDTYDVEVLDHIVTGHPSHTSLRSLGYFP